MWGLVLKMKEIRGITQQQKRWGVVVVVLSNYSLPIQNTKKPKKEQNEVKMWAVHHYFQEGKVPPTMVLPEELGSWWTQLKDPTDQALTLI